jgi:hypothetical protein
MTSFCLWVLWISTGDATPTGRTGRVGRVGRGGRMGRMGRGAMTTAMVEITAMKTRVMVETVSAAV